jgi:hypothetical protein
MLHFCDLLDQMDSDVQDMIEALSVRAAPYLPAELLSAVAAHVRDFDFDEASALLRGHPLLQDESTADEAEPHALAAVTSAD